MRGTTLVFDLDGTIADTAPDLARAANHVLAGQGLAPLDLDFLKPAISFGARQMLVSALAQHGQRRPEGEIDGLLDQFLSYYSDNIAIDSRPYPGLVPLLEMYRDEGATLAVCTNKREALSRKLLDALRLTPLFHAIAGRDTFAVFKPHPDHVLGTIKMAGGNRRRAVMVGDSDTDIRAARAAAVPVIAVTFGYTYVPVTQLGADAVIDDYAEFAGALARVLPT